jgi:nucleotide-binding universal stress UspA family protein
VPEPTYRVSFLFRKILVPIDGSENSLRALDVAVDFAKRYGSKLTVLYVVEPGTDVSTVKSIVEKRLAETHINYEFKARQFSPSTSSVANEIIQEVVEGGYDLIILGARGNTVNEELMIGSTVLSVLVNAPASVMVIR